MVERQMPDRRQSFITKFTKMWTGPQIVSGDRTAIAATNGVVETNAPTDFVGAMIASGAKAPTQPTRSMSADPAARPLVGEMKKIFNSAWYVQNANSILALAELCAYIRRKYSTRERREILGGVDRTRFDKLKKLGQDQRLRKIRHLLPPSESTLCLLSRFADDELDEAMATGIVHPDATRRELEVWRSRRRRQADSQPVEATLRIFRPIMTLAPGTSDADVAAIMADIEELRQRHNAITDITYPERQAEDRENARFERRATACLRRRVREIISEQKKERLKGRPPSVSKKEWKREQWPYSAADLHVGATDGWDRLRAVLDRLGMGDEFEELQDAAYLNVG